MDRIAYTEERMNNIQTRVQKMIEIVNELEKDFPGRHFTLDGHLIGSIGEVMAAYYYGVELYTASTEIHDGEVNGKKVQIKMCQQDNIVISHEPEYLIVLYLNKNGSIYEVYNGPGKSAWDSAGKRDSHNSRHMRVNKLLGLSDKVKDADKIRQVHPVERLKLENKNRN